MTRKRKILYALIAVTLLFIWIHSAMDPETSSDESGWVKALIEPFLELFLGKGNVTEHFVRKLAHFTEFAALGLELGLLLGTYRKKRALQLALSADFALLAAVMDETVQIFSGRGSSLKDVWLDFAGAVCGIAVAAAAAWIAGNARSGRRTHAGG